MKMNLTEKNVPVEIIENKEQYIVILSFQKPVSKELVELINRLSDLMSMNMSAD